MSDQKEKDLAASKKNDQGHHECEVLGCGPVVFESDRAWKNCVKNRGHANFIPAHEFCLDYLPEKWKNAAVLQRIQSSVPQTVRLRIGYTSWERPEGYCFSSHRGSKVVHLGSGMLRRVWPRRGPCKCFDCAQSSSPCQEWFELHLITACHVVYNTEEAQRTRVDFFFDDEGSQKDGRMKTVWGLEVSVSDEAADTCRFLAAAHDRSLAQQLMAFTMQIGHTLSSKNYNPEPTNFLAIVISHPHGQSKKVTVGKVLSRNDVSPLLSQFNYATDTCPGSSGAPVLLIDASQPVPFRFNMSLIPLHSKWLPEEGVNQNVSWWF